MLCHLYHHFISNLCSRKYQKISVFSVLHVKSCLTVDFSYSPVHAWWCLNSLSMMHVETDLGCRQASQAHTQCSPSMCTMRPSIVLLKYPLIPQVETFPWRRDTVCVSKTPVYAILSMQITHPVGASVPTEYMLAFAPFTDNSVMYCVSSVERTSCPEHNLASSNKADPDCGQLANADRNMNSYCTFIVAPYSSKSRR